MDRRKTRSDYVKEGRRGKRGSKEKGKVGIQGIWCNCCKHHHQPQPLTSGF